MNNKPMIIAIEETEQMLVGAVNTALASGVTPYFLKMVFDKVGAQINEMSKDEMKMIREHWENQIAENEAKESEKPRKSTEA